VTLIRFNPRLKFFAAQQCVRIFQK